MPEPVVCPHCSRPLPRLAAGAGLAMDVFVLDCSSCDAIDASAAASVN